MAESDNEKITLGERWKNIKNSWGKRDVFGELELWMPGYRRGADGVEHGFRYLLFGRKYHNQQTPRIKRRSGRRIN